MANKVLNLTTLVTDLSSDSSKSYTYADISMTSSNLKVSKLTDLKAIKNSLHNIFSWIPGQRILDPLFGSDLYRFLYEGITDLTKDKVQASIQSSVSKYEPRVKITDISYSDTSTDDIDNNQVNLVVTYEVPTLNAVSQKETLIYDSKYQTTNDSENE